MRAIILRAFGEVTNFEERAVDLPEMKEHEVLVKIKASAFNPIDYQMRRGGAESRLLKQPILGRELSGTVIKTGNQAGRFQIGDEVTAYVGSLASNGTYAEMISIPHQLVVQNPAWLSFIQAAAIPMTGMTALQCVRRLDIKDGGPVFIAGGAGGVGTVLIKLLLASGITKIITTAGDTESKKHLLGLGLSPDNVIDYKLPEVIALLQAQCEGGGFKYCIDLVGGGMSEIGAAVLGIQGTYADVTFQSTQKAREILFDKAATIINVANYAYGLTGNRKEISVYGNMLEDIFDKIDHAIITPPDIHVVGGLSVATVQEAHRLMEENQIKGRKLVMVHDL